MFEKEAEEYADRTKTEKELEVLETVHNWGQESLSPSERRLFEGIQDRERAREQGFKDGAEFGYNKANEWHYDEPTESKNNFYVILKNGNHRICYWDLISKADKCLKNVVNGEHITFNFIRCWKEIVLPELKESE